jgi:uncharacterized circularly permuted ATP-grasp superfamily protein
VPSGMSYVAENCRTMARVFPGLFLDQQVRPVAAYPGWLLDALRRSAPVGAEEPVVVLLTPVWATRPISSTPSWPARWA